MGTERSGVALFHASTLEGRGEEWIGMERNGKEGLSFTHPHWKGPHRSALEGIARERLNSMLP